MPNIAIYEGGKAARMNGVSLITTDDGDGGKIEWVPQSDRQTGTLYVHENGTYRAEDEGLHSWSKVSVRLAGAPAGLSVPTLPDPITLAEIPTGEIGEIEPVAPAGLEPIEDIEPISVEEAESILEDVGLDPSDLDPDSPSYDDAMEAIADALGVDPDDVKVIDPEKKDDVKKEQPKVEDKGQKAVGTDPDTGDPATITPSGKEGAIVPDELRIVVEPSKKSYEDGETIDYSGIQCALYKDGKFLRNATFEELSFPMSTAEYSGDYPTEYTNGEINAALYTLSGHGGMTYHQTPRGWKYESFTSYCTQPVGTYIGRSAAIGSASGETSGYYFLTTYEGKLFVKGKGNLSIYTYSSGTSPLGPTYGWHLSMTSTFNAREDRFKLYEATAGGPVINAPQSTKDPRLGESSPIWAVGQHQPVPVEWSGSGASLGSSFEIMVYVDNV